MPNTKIKLGQLVSDPLYPEITAGAVVETPTDAIREFAPVPTHYDSSESKSTNMDIGAKILALISFGLIGSHCKEEGIKYESGGMTQLEFEPPAEYVNTSLAQEDVQEYIQSRATVFGSPPLYMVVGLRIAHGAKFTYFRTRKTDGGVDLATDGLLTAGVPVDPTIRFRRTTESNGNQTVTIDHDFVLAYRLKECKYSRSSGLIKPMYHTKKATMMDLKSRGADGNTVTEGPEDAANVITSLGLSKFDLNARTLGLDKKCVRKILEDDNCECILLNVAQEVV